MGRAEGIFTKKRKLISILISASVYYIDFSVKDL